MYTEFEKLPHVLRILKKVFLSVIVNETELLFIACYFFLNDRYFLLAAHYFYLLLVTFSSLLVIFCSLLVTFCSLLVTFCLLLVAFSPSFYGQLPD